MYSPPANPERVTSEGLKRRDKGVHISKIKYDINSIGYKNIANNTQETPELHLKPREFPGFPRSFRFVWFIWFVWLIGFIEFQEKTLSLSVILSFKPQNCSTA